MFVVFEGIDGSGKTSISNRVAAELARQGRSVKHLRAEREQVARHCKEALDGFEGVDSPEAWTLRDASYDIWPSSVVKTLALGLHCGGPPPAQ